MAIAQEHAMLGGMPIRVTAVGDDTYRLEVILGAGDIELGAVEIKNATDDTRAVVDADGLEVHIDKALPAGTNNIGDVDIASALPAGTNNIGDVDIATALPAGTNLIGLTQPFSPILHGELTELIGINERVDQNEYSASVGVSMTSGSPVSGSVSGEVLHTTLYSHATGSGSVLTPAGTLMFCNGDPNMVTSGSTAMPVAVRRSIIGQIVVAVADWKDDALGASVTIPYQPLAFHELSSIYLVWFHEDATAYNDNAADDEILEADFWYRRDS